MRHLFRGAALLALIPAAATAQQGYRLETSGKQINESQPLPVKITGSAPSRIGTSASVGKVTSLPANTSTVVCAGNPATIAYEVQNHGTAPVLLGLDGQSLTAATPSQGAGSYILLPTQYSMYSGNVARTNDITAFSTVAQMVVCNTVTG